MALWVYEQRNTICLLWLFSIDLHFTHIYSMPLETRIILHCLMCVTLSRHYIGKIHDHSLTTQHRSDLRALLRHNIGKISERSPFTAVVWEILLLTHTRGNVISHVMGEGGASWYGAS